MWWRQIVSQIGLHGEFINERDGSTLIFFIHLLKIQAWSGFNNYWHKEKGKSKQENTMLLCQYYPLAKPKLPVFFFFSLGSIIMLQLQ